MCLNIVFNEGKKQEVLDALPDPFPVWKYLNKNGRSWYGSQCRSHKMPNLLDGRWHEAEHMPYGKVYLLNKYPPGFHSFLRKEDAVAASRCTYSTAKVIRKFWLWKKDVTVVGLSEITEGKKELEDIFSQSVSGMIWPYGVSTCDARDFAAKHHEYGRTTPAPGRVWLAGCYRLWDIVPYHWRLPIELLFNTNHTHIALSGHTYELTTEDDWQYLDDLLRTLSQDSGVRLVTLSELAKEIQGEQS